MDDSWGDTLTRSSIFVLSNEFFLLELAIILQDISP